jgi:glycosyltransferase involved in cell wall biosynthesis
VSTGVKRVLADADVILARMPCFESVAATYLRRRGQVVIHWFGGELADGPPEGRVYFAEARRRVALRAMIAAARRADLILTQGTAMRDWLGRHGVQARSVVKGVLDEEDFVEPRPRFRDRAIRLLTVARLEHVKNPGLLVEAIALLRQGGRDYRLEVVGEGTLRTRLEERAAALGLSDAVTFTGEVDDRARLHELYRRADAFLLASLTEGISSAAMEAMAAGLPTIVPDVGGMADIVRDGENGFLLRRPTAAGIAELVGSLARDHARADEVGTRAAHDARSFLWSRWVDEFAELARGRR